MCLYPRLIRNPKYIPNKKNGGQPPIASDIRTLTVPIGCGECIECMKQQQRKWQIRLSEEIRENNNAEYVTLTFSDEEITNLYKEKAVNNLSGYNLDNAVAKIAVRRFYERWRKKYKKSIRHWLVTELGQEKKTKTYTCTVLYGQETKQKYNKNGNTEKYGSETM